MKRVIEDFEKPAGCRIFKSHSLNGLMKFDDYSNHSIAYLVFFFLIFLLLSIGCAPSQELPTQDITQEKIHEEKTADVENTAIAGEASKKVTQEIAPEATTHISVEERAIQGEVEKVTSQITGKQVLGGEAAVQIPAGIDIQKIIEQKTKEITGQITGKKSEEVTPEVSCDLTPIPRKFSSTPYYTGSLVDSHVHMPTSFPIPAAIAQQIDWNAPTFGTDITQSEFICVFDKGKVKSAIGFYITLNIFPDTFVSGAKQMEKQYPGRIAPFITPAHLASIDLTPQQIEEIITSNPGLFKGLGEIAFYRAEYKGMSPEDPKFLALYDLAKKYNLIVMIHPDEGQGSVLERILQKYPAVKFLFHGNAEMGPYAAEIVAKYPNAYFTIDADLWDLPEEGQSVNLYGSGSKEKFIADMKRDYTPVQKAALTRWKSAIEANPDKYLWGTDRADLWHFDAEVSALVEESGRAFIGQLDPAVQEKFAWKNAERLIKWG